MSPILLFLIFLLVGALFIFCGSKLEGKGQIFFMIFGGLFVLLGGYGIFTAFCK